MSSPTRTTAGILSIADLFVRVDGAWRIRPEGLIRSRLASQVARGELRIAPSVEAIPEDPPITIDEIEAITVAGVALQAANPKQVRTWALTQQPDRPPTFTTEVPPKAVWRLVSSKHLLPKEKSLLYQLQVNAFFTRERLNRAYPLVDPTCQRCHDDIETRRHRFESCPYVRVFWLAFQSLILGRQGWASMDDMWTLVQQAGPWPKDVKVAAFGCAMFFIHRNHTQFIYKETWIEPRDLARIWLAEFAHRIKARRAWAARQGTLAAYEAKWSGIAHRIRVLLV